MISTSNELYAMVRRIASTLDARGATEHAHELREALRESSSPTEIWLALEARLRLIAAEPYAAAELEADLAEALQGIESGLRRSGIVERT